MKLGTLALLVASAVGVGCTLALDCTEIGCSGSYTMTFESDTWEDGNYTVSVAFDGGEPETCAFTLPLTDEACNLTPVTLVGDAITVSIPTIMDDTLLEADIALELDGTRIFSEVVEPDWGEPVYPNGEECDAGMGCLSAEDTFGL